MVQARKAPSDGAVLIVPVRLHNGSYLWAHSRLRGAQIPKGEERAAATFLEHWTSLGSPLLRPHVDQLVSLLQHSLSFARLAASQGLIVERIRVRTLLTSAHVREIGRILMEPGWSAAERKRALDVLGALRAPLVGDWLAKHFLRDIPAKQRIQAALILARTSSRSVLRGLRQCIRDASGLLKRVCQRRLAARLQTQKVK